MVDLEHCPSCGKDVASGSALVAHLEYAHDIDDPVAHLIDLDGPARRALLHSTMIRVGRVGAVALAAVAVDALVAA